MAAKCSSRIRLSNSISEVVTSTDDVGGAYLMGARSGAWAGFGGQFPALRGQLSLSGSDGIRIGDGKRLGGPGIHVGDGPSALAFSNAGHLLFVVDARSGDVAVVRTANRQMFTMLPAGRGPNAIAVKAFRTS